MNPTVTGLVEEFESLKRLVGIQKALADLPECKFRDALCVRVAQAMATGSTQSLDEAQREITELKSTVYKHASTIDNLTRLLETYKSRLTEAQKGGVRSLFRG